ncbi:hypothetical protein [Streptomyces tendae]|nr:hypothetical protein [Streptomyces tendae]
MLNADLWSVRLADLVVAVLPKASAHLLLGVVKLVIGREPRTAFSEV